jgi:hypothetical protein
MPWLGAVWIGPARFGVVRHGGLWLGLVRIGVGPLYSGHLIRGCASCLKADKKRKFGVKLEERFLKGI